MSVLLRSRAPRRLRRLQGTGLVTLALAAVLATVGIAPVSQARPGSGPGVVLGQDGLMYQISPGVIYGADGNLFLGLDYDQSCEYGAKIERGMHRLAKLSRLIEKSGRRVIWTVVPSKSFLQSNELIPANFPQGDCDSVGIAQQSRVLDRFSDPNYLPLRRALKATKAQTYWKTDPHWDSVGGAVYTRLLAKRLDPRLARRQHYTIGSYTNVGLLETWLNQTTPETVPEAIPVHAVTTRSTGDQQFTALPDIVYDYTWSSTPAKKAWPGNTLLIGDSMTLFTLRTLKPLFAHGHFLWTSNPNVAPSEIVDGIKNADTVVIEVAQWIVQTSILGQQPFVSAVKAALR